jgi:hypothetical protein
MFIVDPPVKPKYFVVVVLHTTQIAMPAVDPLVGAVNVLLPE